MAAIKHSKELWYSYDDNNVDMDVIWNVFRARNDSGKYHFITLPKPVIGIFSKYLMNPIDSINNNIINSLKNLYMQYDHEIEYLVIIKN